MIGFTNTETMLIICFSLAFMAAFAYRWAAKFWKDKHDMLVSLIYGMAEGKVKAGNKNGRLVIYSLEEENGTETILEVGQGEDADHA